MTTANKIRYTASMGRRVVKDFQPVAVERPLVLVSITDPKSKLPELNGLWDDVFAFQAHDVFDDESFNIDVLKELHNFIHQYKTTSIFTHCEAGISRSGAVKEFLLRRGWTIYPGFKKWATFPNGSLLALLERIDRENPII